MINAQMLKLKGACAAQVELFEVIFPSGANLTVENALSVALKFEWDWAAQKLLLPENRGVYSAAVKPARDARDAAIRSASRGYAAAKKPAREVYYAVKSAREAYYAVKLASDAHNTAVSSACDVYDAAKARAFAEIYIKQEQTK